MYRYSATQWIFGKEPLERTCARLHSAGYDGIELSGEPYGMDIRATQELLSAYGLSCTSICGIYTPERDLSSADPGLRQRAVQYVKDCIDLAEEVGAAHVIVVPSPVGKLAPAAAREEEWSCAVDSLREAGRYAAGRGVRLAVEALNRYETYMVNRLADAKRLVEEVDVPSVKLMADLFHMNIEERSCEDALRSIATELIHVHLADNTREAAGRGQTDFDGIVSTLLQIGYKGPLTMEFLPRVSDPYAASHRESADEETSGGEDCRFAIAHIRDAVQRAGQKLKEENTEGGTGDEA
ncbi:sugar phosphate isomerase/epimerase family protein [Paenibacillus sp. NPDC056579]|uniref:sugar phosphate isomerase/epimerase family protein n=1 Tax=Paenibacillus sp. NPDC056579 TaxID=3345871 RepID=UPI0036B23272